MPATVVDRLPLPNLKVYTAGSVLLLSVALYQAVNVTSEPGWRVNTTQRQEEVMEPASITLESPQWSNSTRNVTEQFVDVLSYMMQEPLCMWTVINMAYCTLALIGLLVQRVVFGALRVAEAQRLRDKFWNYVFYKFIFVFGVINVQYMDEVLLWCSWFTVLGFLHLLAQLSKDRFDYLSSSPATTRWAHIRLSALVCSILAASSALLGLAFLRGLPHGRDYFAFMAAECILVQLCAAHTLSRYVLRLCDTDAASPIAYYTHLVFDVTSLCVELCDVIHMVVYSRLVVSMGSLVLLLQLRQLLAKLSQCVSRHKRAGASRLVTSHYPMASKEEVEKNQDNCAICWEPMKEARKLPCDHLFHNACLCQWVVQDASCPTCRRPLAVTPPSPSPSPLHNDNNTNNHLFHFDGSRYVSWLPSFSVEVTRVRALPPPPLSQANIDAMTQQVSVMFPMIPRGALAAELARTRSADLTVHHILEGRLAGLTDLGTGLEDLGTGLEDLVPGLVEVPDPPNIITDMEEVSAIAAALDISAPERRTVPVVSAVSALSAGTAVSHLGTLVHQATGTDDLPSSLGTSSTKFATEASERETMLQRRKEQLINEARKKYLENMAARPQTQS